MLCDYYRMDIVYKHRDDSELSQLTYTYIHPMTKGTKAHMKATINEIMNRPATEVYSIVFKKRTIQVEDDDIQTQI